MSIQRGTRTLYHSATKVCLPPLRFAFIPWMMILLFALTSLLTKAAWAWPMQMKCIKSHCLACRTNSFERQSSCSVPIWTLILATAAPPRQARATAGVCLLLDWSNSAVVCSVRRTAFGVPRVQTSLASVVLEARGAASSVVTHRQAHVKRTPQHRRAALEAVTC